MAKEANTKSKKDKKEKKEKKPRAFRGFRKAEGIGRIFDKYQEKHPLTKESAGEYLKFVKGVQAHVALLDLEVKRVLGIIVDEGDDDLASVEDA